MSTVESSEGSMVLTHAEEDKLFTKAFYNIPQLYDATNHHSQLRITLEDMNFKETDNQSFGTLWHHYLTSVLEGLSFQLNNGTVNVYIPRNFLQGETKDEKQQSLDSIAHEAKTDLVLNTIHRLQTDKPTLPAVPAVAGAINTAVWRHLKSLHKLDSLQHVGDSNARGSLNSESKVADQVTEQLHSLMSRLGSDWKPAAKQEEQCPPREWILTEGKTELPELLDISFTCPHLTVEDIIDSWTCLKSFLAENQRKLRKVQTSMGLESWDKVLAAVIQFDRLLEGASQKVSAPLCKRLQHAHQLLASTIEQWAAKKPLLTEVLDKEASETKFYQSHPQLAERILLDSKQELRDRSSLLFRLFDSEGFIDNPDTTDFITDAPHLYAMHQICLEAKQSKADTEKKPVWCYDSFSLMVTNEDYPVLKVLETKIEEEKQLENTTPRLEIRRDVLKAIADRTAASEQ